MNQSIAPSEERTWCMLAHLSAILNIFVPAIGGLIGTGIIWLIFKEKSKKITFHSLQALGLQAIQLAFILVVVVGTWVMGFIFSFATVGFGTLIAVPLMILTFFLGGAVVLASTIYGIYGAYCVNKGEDFHYKWVGDWVSRKIHY